MNNSEPYDLEREVNRFCYDHKEDLRQVLKEAYARYTCSSIYDDDMRKDILFDSDFPASVGFPLFLLFIATLLCAYFPKYCGKVYILASCFIAFGFLIRIYAKHVISITSWRLFRRHRYPSVVQEYVDTFREADILNAETPAEKANINKLYDHCVQELSSSMYFLSLHEVKNRKLDKIATNHK